MAKLVGPLHSAEARGRVSGLIYNTWRGISYAKAFCSPAQPGTQRQLQVRAWAVQLVRAWASLTSTQQGTWNQYAVDHPYIDWTGNPKRLTGANYYLALNLRMLDMGKTVQTSAPVTNAPDAVAAFVAADGVGQSSCSWTAFAGTDKSVDLWGYGPHSAGRIPTLQRAKHKVYVPGETSPYVLTGLGLGLWTIYARCVDEDNGLASTWVWDNATIT